MDDTVNNFLKEINEIVPPKHVHGQTENGWYSIFLKTNNFKKFSVAWKECFDKQSGFPYYWNLNTDEVTWEMPEELKNKQKKTGLYIPPKTLPSGSVPVPAESVKIYKIESESSTKPVPVIKATVEKKNCELKRTPVKKPFKSNADSDDE